MQRPIIGPKALGTLASLLLLIPGFIATAHAQLLIARPDSFTVPQGQTLVVDAPGILDNDTVNDQGAGDLGAVAVLVADVLHGTLNLASDGSFTYIYDSGFDGHDEFTYDMTIGGESARATVTLAACTLGPGPVVCWKQSEFLARAQALGLTGFREGFEDDGAWGGARTPAAQPAVTSQGLSWTSNHPDAPAGNPISTTPGPPHSGLYAGFDPDHGYATGSPGECDVDNPPLHCLYHDGLSGAVQAGTPPLYGVGAWIDGTYGSNVKISLDGGALLGGVRITFGQEFIGVIDRSPAGFSSFSIVETDGKIGQNFLVFLDDITLLTRPVSALPGEEPSTRVFFAGAGPNPLSGNTTLRFSLREGDDVRLAVFDQRGRRVQTLVRGYRETGDYAVRWDGRDTGGRPAAAGLYFGRLEVGRGADRFVQIKKMILLR